MAPLFAKWGLVFDCEIVDTVLAEIESWTGGAPAEDDVTLVIMRRTDEA